MHGLAEQRLIIYGLERSTAAKRVRLIQALGTFDPPVEAAMVAVGTALMVADLAPGVSAVNGLFADDLRPGERFRRVLKLIIEVPLLVSTVRRLLP